MRLAVQNIEGPSGPEGPFGPEIFLSGPLGPRVCGEAAGTVLCSLGVQSKTFKVECTEGF